jgi:Golgi nucleoside diphosphatase
MTMLLFTIATYFLLTIGISLSTIITLSPSSSPTDGDEKLESKPASPYKIVIDGGSTGSRLHIFEFKYDPQLDKTTVERRGSTKVNTPLSNFAIATTDEDDTSTSIEDGEDDNHVALHLLPLFKYASEIIPSKYHSITPISFQATAGMRLVNQKDQFALYSTIHETLMNHDEFVFDSFRRTDISTLDGMLEGLYGVIAVNYLKGVVDVNLHFNDVDNDDAALEANVNTKANPNANVNVTDSSNIISSNDQDMNDEEQDNKIPLGALDMGGASMQIVFLPPSSSNLTESGSKKLPKNNNNEGKEKLPSHEFFSTSYLSYGSDQFRERLWDTWVLDTEKSEQEQLLKDAKEGRHKIIHNPCSFKGYETEWKGFTLFGTGDAQQCAQEVNRLLPHHQEVDDNNYYDDDFIVGGIEHPPINGEFYAMSLFFFVMDCVRTYTKDETLLLSWPKPSIHELSAAVESFCSKHWLHDIKHKVGDDLHEFTRAEILSERCFQSVYIVTLLRDGFGFDVHSRDITYSFLVDGSEVEWSLGMAIALYAEEGNSSTSLELGTSQTTNKCVATDDNLIEAHTFEDNSTNSNHCSNDGENSVSHDSRFIQFFRKLWSESLPI